CETPTESYKVHELAKELEMTSNDLVLKLREMGFSVKAANSTVPPEAVAAIKGQKKEG
ncbi:MAG: translation initiation factor IF-2 N-terminal domain-containing protein, partial [Candidatus Margulisbacteria bacterium]|nr:translation initiation factor IF-2 N-terminal domain-containing protein [Candidatus Margulisiibacteriota bacterium]